jgi:hypothetical protein
VQRTVQLFLAERVTPAMTRPDQYAIHWLLINASRRLSESGTPVALLRSTYLPSRGRWTATFSATSAETVHRAIEIAQLPSVEVSEAIEIALPGEARPPELSGNACADSSHGDRR